MPMVQGRHGRRPHRALALMAMVAVTGWTSASAQNAPSTPEAVRTGRTLYQAKCSSCHGANGKAQVQAMANAADLTHPEWFKKGGSDAAMFASVQNGVGNAMPPFKGDLTPAETWKVIAYLRTIRAPAKTK